MRRKRPFPKIPFLLCLIILAVVFLEYQSFRKTPQLSSVSGSAFISGLIAQDGVPAIDHPKFESVSVADQYLNNDGLGVVVQANQMWRFYPYQLLVWHQVVNDTFGSTPLLILYNPVSMSSAAYERIIQGETFDFGLSDTIDRGNVLLYDRATHSLWNPMTHVSVDGKKRGVALARDLSWIMTWATFKQTHPNGQVLSRQTGFSRDYTHDPYGNYRYDDSIIYPVQIKDYRLRAKELVYGVEWNGKQKAYPLKMIEQQQAIQDQLDGTSILVTQDEKTNVIHAFQLDGSGKPTTEIPITESYWFAWVSAFPQTDLKLP